MSSHRHRLLACALAAGAVLVLPACSGGASPTPSASPTPGAGNVVDVIGNDALKFEPDAVAARAGEVTINLTSDGELPHDIVIAELGEEPVVEVIGHGSDTAKLDLAAGTYTLFCSIPGHREAGMEATLTVS